jgi:hypothetical protein
MWRSIHPPAYCVERTPPRQTGFGERIVEFINRLELGRLTFFGRGKAGNCERAAAYHEHNNQRPHEFASLNRENSAKIAQQFKARRFTPAGLFLKEAAD